MSVKEKEEITVQDLNKLVCEGGQGEEERSRLACKRDKGVYWTSYLNFMS